MHVIRRRLTARTTRSSLTSGRLWNFFLFFFNDTATTEIYTLSLHDALPISMDCPYWRGCPAKRHELFPVYAWLEGRRDRKSTRLNSSHQIIPYAVFSLKKKKPGLVRGLSCAEDGGADVDRIHCHPAAPTPHT